MTNTKQILYVALIMLIACCSRVALSDETIVWADLPDFDEFRQERGARTDFAESCGINGRADSDDQTVSYLNTENWESAAHSAEARLQRCPVDVQFHMYLSIALEELDRNAEAKTHADWYRGLVNSILKSGDGRTPDSAYITISIAEEYAILSVYGLKPINQSLVQGGRDRFEVEDENGDQHEIYFFPELHWKRLADLFPE